VHESKPEVRIFRFGIFEFHTDSFELRKEGRTESRLRDQAGQILVMLLERSRDVVTREELRERLWLSDTFVDFDHGLNTAINQLRSALGDSAANPRFIQTVPRRGYRFIAPVETTVGGGAAATLPATNQLRMASEILLDPADPKDATLRPARPLLLSDPADLPLVSNKTVRILFSLIQVVYLTFYIVSLARLSILGEILTLPENQAHIVLVLLIITAVVGIPTRLYLFSAIAFNYRGLNVKFQRLFPFLLILDELWALAPFLIVQQIGAGLALAATAALLYLPFSQRSLLLMGSSRQVS
jgi:cholera toxin transcriptional activator